MKKNLLLFGISLVLLGQFLLVLITGLVEHHPPPTLHAVMGIVLIACSIIHLSLHWRWIVNAFHNHNRMPEAARANVSVNILLFLGYLACGFSGLIAAEFSSHLFRHLHQLLALGVIIVQAIHLGRHWKWIQNVWKRWLLNLSSNFQKESDSLQLRG